MEHTISTAELPYPNGWFAVAFSSELRAGRVLRQRLMGEDVVVYRTRSGVPVVTRPYCPHLGAHLGHGGTVDGEDIVCPFHQFAFAPDGGCVRTGYGTCPPRMRLETYVTREVNGAILIWRHAEGLPPSWEIPELRAEGFASPILQSKILTAYPQDIHENAFDVGHFSTLHGYRSAEVESVSFDGVASRSNLVTWRYFPLAGALRFPFRTQGYGVGFTRIVADIPQIHSQSEAFFHTTPTGPRVLDFRVSVSVRGPSRGAGRAALVLSWALARTLGRSMRTDLVADYRIWANKAYVDRPRLADGDGPIQRYRRWTRQFYTLPVDEEPPLDVPMALEQLNQDTVI